MGQREKVVRLIHRVIVESGVFGSGQTARVAMSYAPLVDSLPFIVYDVSQVEYVEEDNDPADQIVSVEVSLQVFASDGFSAAKATDRLHSHLLSTGILLMASGLRTISEDYTPVGDRPRGLVRMESVYLFDAR